MDTPIPVANKSFPFLGGCDSAVQPQNFANDPGLKFMSFCILSLFANNISFIEMLNSLSVRVIRLEEPNRMLFAQMASVMTYFSFKVNYLHNVVRHC